MKSPRNKRIDAFELVNRFLIDCRNRNLSETTIDFYDGYLFRFIKGINGHIFLQTKYDVASFLDSLTCNAGGKAAYYRVIRVFYRWAINEEIIERSPIDKMKAPKVPKPIRHKVDVESIPVLVDGCDSVRDKLIVCLLADTGLRRSELANIQTSDIDHESQVICIWGKGAKQRLVRYGPVSARFLKAYLDQREASDRLFDIAEWGITHVMKGLERKTGIKCNAHAFRRTFATESVRNGLNLFYVQSLLGHSSLTMTRIYAEQVNSEDAIKAYVPIVA